MTIQKQQLQLSVLDRLQLGTGKGVLGDGAADIDVVRNGVLRDVENLLNTRRTIAISPVEGFSHVNRSLYTYGIDDFVAHNPKSGSTQKRLESAILDTIAKFEPRLRNVRVEIQPVDAYDPHLCFTVQATLMADPISEPILFNTWFSASRGEYRVDLHRKES